MAFSFWGLIFLQDAGINGWPCDMFTRVGSSVVRQITAIFKGEVRESICDF